MEDIEFRGKRKENGQWVYGYFYKNLTSKSCIHEIKEYASGKFMSNIYEVIPETVGRYTGFKDKSGTKIFEGHILTDGKNNYLVDFYRGAWKLKSYEKGDAWYKSLYRYAKDLEIIGNIFENPELIGGVKDE